MKLISRTITLFAFGLCLASAHAQTMTSQSLAECMIASSGESDEAILKKLMIRAMQDAPADELKGITIEMGMSMVSLATVDCGTPSWGMPVCGRFPPPTLLGRRGDIPVEGYPSGELVPAADRRCTRSPGAFRSQC